MPEKAATARGGRARSGNAGDASAGKRKAAAAPAGPASRPARRAGPAPAARPAAPPPGPQPEEEPLITTVRIPGYLAENIRRWLFENPGHTQHSMIFAGLAKLGIEVRDDDLEPRRRPRSSRGRR